MRLWKSASRRQQKKHAGQIKQKPEDVSIGSELSSRDQFEIVVPKKLDGQNGAKKKTNASFINMFGNDADSSTVSSITAHDHKALYRFTRGYRKDADAMSLGTSWCCCCTDTTTSTSDATNTLLAQHSFGHSISHPQPQYQQGTNLCGPDFEPVPPSRRPKLLARKNRRTSTKTGASSLFDTLTDDELDERTARSRRRFRRQQSKLSKAPSFRHALTWKRKAVL
jgi:hypothetical protein